MNKKSKVVSLATTALIATLLLNANQAKADTENKEADNTDTKSASVAKDPQTAAKDAKNKYYQAQNDLRNAKVKQQSAQYIKKSTDEQVDQAKTSINQQKEEINKIKQINSETPTAKTSDLDKAKKDVITAESNWNTDKTKLKNLLETSDKKFNDYINARSDQDKINEAQRKIGADHLHITFANDALIYASHSRDYYDKHGAKFYEGYSNSYNGLQYIHKYEKEFNAANMEESIETFKKSKEQSNNRLHQAEESITHAEDILEQLKSDIKNNPNTDPTHEQLINAQTELLYNQEQRMEALADYTSINLEKLQRDQTYYKDEISKLQDLANLYKDSPQNIKNVIKKIQDELNQDNAVFHKVTANLDVKTISIKNYQAIKNWDAFQNSCHSAADRLMNDREVLSHKNNMVLAFTEPEEALSFVENSLHFSQLDLASLLTAQKADADKLAKATKALAVAQANYDAAKSAMDKADQALNDYLNGKKKNNDDYFNHVIDDANQSTSQDTNNTSTTEDTAKKPTTKKTVKKQTKSSTKKNTKTASKKKAKKNTRKSGRKTSKSAARRSTKKSVKRAKNAVITIKHNKIYRNGKPLTNKQIRTLLAKKFNIKVKGTYKKHGFITTYDAKGRKMHKRFNLSKKYRILGFKMIHKTLYVRIGKNTYVKYSNMFKK